MLGRDHREGRHSPAARARHIKTSTFIVVSPVLGMCSRLLTVAVSWICRDGRSARRSLVSQLQLVSSALYSMATAATRTEDHGHHLAAPDFRGRDDHGHLPHWSSSPAMSRSRSVRFSEAGASSRRWPRITKLKPVGGFAAETGGAIVALPGLRLRIPVSTSTRARARSSAWAHAPDARRALGCRRQRRDRLDPDDYGIRADGACAWWLGDTFLASLSLSSGRNETAAAESAAHLAKFAASRRIRPEHDEIRIDPASMRPRRSVSFQRASRRRRERGRGFASAKALVPSGGTPPWARSRSCSRRRCRRHLAAGSREGRTCSTASPVRAPRCAAELRAPQFVRPERSVGTTAMPFAASGR